MISLNEAIEKYLLKYDEKIISIFNTLKKIIYDSVFFAITEKMWANQPSYYVNDLFVRLIVFNDHINIQASAITQFKEELNGYKTSKTGMLQLHKNDDIPTEILKKIFNITLSSNYFKDKIIGKTIAVKIDRPLGTFHPKHKDIYYSLNYGYVEGLFAKDGEEQDVYIVGVDKPISEFTGKIIAIIYRFDDVEEKWVVAPEGVFYTKDQIEKLVDFQEKYFKTKILM